MKELINSSVVKAILLGLVLSCVLFPMGVFFLAAHITLPEMSLCGLGNCPWSTTREFILKYARQEDGAEYLLDGLYMLANDRDVTSNGQLSSLIFHVTYTEPELKKYVYDLNNKILTEGYRQVTIGFLDSNPAGKNINFKSATSDSPWPDSLARFKDVEIGPRDAFATTMKYAKSGPEFKHFDLKNFGWVSIKLTAIPLIEETTSKRWSWKIAFNYDEITCEIDAGNGNLIGCKVDD